MSPGDELDTDDYFLSDTNECGGISLSNVTFHDVEIETHGWKELVVCTYEVQSETEDVFLRRRDRLFDPANSALERGELFREGLHQNTFFYGACQSYDSLESLAEKYPDLAKQIDDPNVSKMYTGNILMMRGNLEDELKGKVPVISREMNEKITIRKYIASEMGLQDRIVETHSQV